MVYLYINKRGNKRYYYLRKAYRKGKKIKQKTLCYIGKELPKINLKKIRIYCENNKSFNRIKKKLEEIVFIEKSKKIDAKENKYFDKNQFSETNAILIHYQKKLKRKKAILKNRIIEKFNISFAKENSSIDSIEEINLNIKETQELLEKNILPKNKPLIQVYKIINTKKIMEFLKNENPKINPYSLERLSGILNKGLISMEGYRKQEMIKWKKPFKVSKVKDIKTDLSKLLKWYNKNKTKIHPLALTILFHHKFEKIHPFIGINGELGRLLMNYQLHQLGYPPMIINSKLKQEYYKVMDKAYPCLKKDLLNTDMKYYKPLIDFMHRQFVKTYWDNFVV